MRKNEPVCIRSSGGRTACLTARLRGGRPAEFRRLCRRNVRPPGRVYAPGFRLNDLALYAANFLSSGQPERFPCQLRSRRLSDFGRNKFIFMLDKTLLPVYDA